MLWSQRLDASVAPTEAPDTLEADIVTFEETVTWLVRQAVSSSAIVVDDGLRYSVAEVSEVTRGRFWQVVGNAALPRGVALVAQLIISATVQIPTPRGVSPEVRAAVGRIRSDLRRVMRDIMNQARQSVRAIGPRDTGRMVRGARVKSVRSLVPGGVSVEFRLSQFYSSFTNESGPREGWFNRIVAEV